MDVGSTVGLVTLDGLKRLRVSGIYRIGTTASLGGALVSSIPLADAQHWYALDGKFTQVNLQAEPGRVQDHIARPRRDRARPALQGADRIREGQGRLEGHRRRHQRLPRPRAAGVRRRGGAGRRLHHLQHVLDHGRAADPRDRDAAHARREPQAGADQRPARGAHDRPDRHGHRHLRRAPDRARHQRAVRRRRVRPALDLAVSSPRRASCSGSSSGSASRSCPH